MSQYLVLIHEDENFYATAAPEVMEQVMQAHGEFQTAAGKAIVGGEALQPSAATTSIRKDTNGEFTVTDGPFAETKEAIGGYYLIEAADLDEALAVAKQVPVFAGGVEVRPVMVFS